jgi:Site-specific recombinase XerD
MAEIMQVDEGVISLKDFVAGCRTKGTGNAYRVGIIDFLSVIYGKRRADRKCTDAEFEEYNNLSIRYLSEKRSAGRDIITLIKWMEEEKRPPKSISLRVTGVREWLKQNDIELTEKEKTNIRRVMPRKIVRLTHNGFFDYEKLQAVLAHLDIRMQALTLCLASSGARVSEILNVRFSDMHDDSRPVSIYLRKTKTAEPRTVFITDEAYAALRSWLKERPEYLKQAGRRAKSLNMDKAQDDPRIFPFELTVIYRAWHRALRKAGLLEKDAETGRNSLTVHRLRAWNRDRIASVVGPDFAEILLGHVDQYGNAYKDTTEQTMREKYLLCQEALTISNTERIKRDIQAQGDELEKVRNENRELRNRMDEMGAMLHILAAQNGLSPQDIRQEAEFLNSMGVKKGDEITIESGIKTVSIAESGGVVTSGGRNRRVRL